MYHAPTKHFRLLRENLAANGGVAEGAEHVVNDGQTIPQASLIDKDEAEHGRAAAEQGQARAADENPAGGVARFFLTDGVGIVVVAFITAGNRRRSRCGTVG